MFNTVKLKAGAYADDVHTLSKADQESMQGIFTQYVDVDADADAD